MLLVPNCNRRELANTGEALDGMKDGGAAEVVDTFGIDASRSCKTVTHVGVQVWTPFVEARRQRGRYSGIPQVKPL